MVIATGQKPADLKIPGTAHLLTTRDQFLELDELPKRILFIGGGYIAFEFAHVAARAAQVNIVHRGPRPLCLFDPGLVDQVVESTRELGVDVQLGTEVVGVEKSSVRLIVRASASGQDRVFETDVVVRCRPRA
jgi:glutathione reductase (NADPH)